MSRFRMIRNTYQPKTSRELLTDLGVGHYNATMIIETLMMAPATTEAAAPPTMMLVGHIQENLNDMGANLIVNGFLDPATAQFISMISGPRFLERSWFDIVKDVVAAKRAGITMKRRMPRPNPKPAVSGFDLPDVPGGVVTYAAAGLLAWHLLSKKKRTSP